MKLTVKQLKNMIKEALEAEGIAGKIIKSPEGYMRGFEKRDNDEAEKEEERDRQEQEEEETDIHNPEGRRARWGLDEEVVKQLKELVREAVLEEQPWMQDSPQKLNSAPPPVPLFSKLISDTYRNLGLLKTKGPSGELATAIDRASRPLMTIAGNLNNLEAQGKNPIKKDLDRLEQQQTRKIN